MKKLRCLYHSVYVQLNSYLHQRRPTTKQHTSLQQTKQFTEILKQ